MAIRGAVVFGIADNGVMPDLAHCLFAREQQQVILVRREFRFQDFQGDKPPGDFRTGPVNIGGATAAQNGSTR